MKTLEIKENGIDVVLLLDEVAAVSNVYNSVINVTLKSGQKFEFEADNKVYEKIKNYMESK